jgi:hypothetical protein
MGPMVTKGSSRATQSQFQELLASVQSQNQLNVKSIDEHMDTVNRGRLGLKTVAMLDRFPRGAYHYAGNLPTSAIGLHNSDQGTDRVTVQASDLWRRDVFVKACEMPSFHALNQFVLT